MVVYSIKVFLFNSRVPGNEAAQLMTQVLLPGINLVHFMTQTASENIHWNQFKTQTENHTVRINSWMKSESFPSLAATKLG